VEELLKTNELAQRILLQLFVEEECLQGYYGRWLRATSEDLVEDMVVFKNSMLCQLAFENKETEEAKKLLFIAKQAFKQHMHPNLRGRIAAWDFILFGDRQTSEDFYTGLHEFTEKLSFLVFFYRLLEVYHQKLLGFDYIETFVVDDLLINFSFPEKHNLNKMYLLQARYFIQKGDIGEARKIMGYLNLRYIYSCDKAWVDRQLAYLEARC
jgi:hypothetical protein